MRRAPGEPVAARGVVLVGVLVVVVVLALLAATALVVADAEVSAAQGALRREQSRAIAWSGVQAVMAELGQQRDAIMTGQAPQLTASWSLFGEPSGQQGVVRLLELEPGRTVVPEAGKLDLNRVSAEVLAASAALDGGAADAVVAARATAPFGSVAEALAVVPERQELTTAMQGAPSTTLDDEGVGTDPGERRLTVFAFEPNTQLGVGGGAAGDPRLFVGDGWSDDLKAPLEERLGEKAAGAIEKTLRAGAPKSMGAVVAGLRREQVPVKDWAAVLDALTVSPDGFLTGRVDVHTAPREVLRAVPGLNDALAEQIERLRDRIDAEARLSVVWLVQQGVLTPAQFEGVVDHVTSRCLQWRVRVEGGFGRPVSGPDGEAAAVRDRVVLEAVVDLSGERPRLAYLRDVTHMESAELIEQLRAESGEGEKAAESALERAADLKLDTGMEDIGLDMDASLDADGGGELELSPMEMERGLELGGGLDLGGARESGSEDGPGPAVKGGLSAVDRRVGRWKIPSKPAGSGR